MSAATRASRLPPASMRWIVPIVLVGVPLLAITSRQVSLLPAAVGAPGETIPPWLLLASISAALAALAARVARPTLATHVVLLAVATFALALLAAHIGQPLANATADYCGDLCRTAIMGRFVAFFGWPVLAAVVLWNVARAEQRRADLFAAVRADWTRSWALVTLVGGLAAATAWWRIILPNG